MNNKNIFQKLIIDSIKDFIKVEQKMHFAFENETKILDYFEMKAKKELDYKTYIKLDAISETFREIRFILERLVKFIAPDDMRVISFFMLNAVSLIYETFLQFIEILANNKIIDNSYKKDFKKNEIMNFLIRIRNIFQHPSKIYWSIEKIKVLVNKSKFLNFDKEDKIENLSKDTNFALNWIYIKDFNKSSIMDYQTNKMSYILMHYFDNDNKKNSQINLYFDFDSLLVYFFKNNTKVCSYLIDEMTKFHNKNKLD